MSIRLKTAPKAGRPKGARSFDETVAKMLGATARARRLDNEMSQEQLADASGLERSYVGRLERGGSQPTLLALLKLAKGLDCDVSELVGPAEKAFRRRK
ncbi:MAG: helix-turn-helix domain-containing protein [Hydrogenophaga sp.]|uniref:helix-turn-helix domain-containing protein n=1 Tax=Hydrogenophaga sp. TaxID=1904254 RepID=UPI00260C7807|nr:helix-turn-helix transcriptional regulator [Hydrogenophaga sp.]MCV0438898.1 helix-turn-helix domain-containing protein [Hydrogenophaga sp.]